MRGYERVSVGFRHSRLNEQCVLAQTCSLYDRARDNVAQPHTPMRRRRPARNHSLLFHISGLLTRNQTT